MSMFRQLWLAIIASTLMALAGSLLVSMLSARAYLESQLSIKNTDNAAALALSPSSTRCDAAATAKGEGGASAFLAGRRGVLALVLATV